MTKLYVSTKNPDKLRELGELLGADVELLHPDPGDPEIEETGATLSENARLKAEAGHRRSGLISLADDTGLEVDALSGAPGVYSARYAGPGASYRDNLQRLLRELHGTDPAHRTARFRCVICCAGVDNEPRRFDGVLAGRIIDTPRGDRGFGYDPVFVPDGEERTLAELSADEKNRISHRGRALRAFLAWWREREAV